MLSTAGNLAVRVLEDSASERKREPVPIIRTTALAHFVKGQIVNIFSFEGHLVSVTTTQFCYCSMKAATDNMQMNGNNCSAKTVFTKTGGRLDLATELPFANLCPGACFPCVWSPGEQEQHPQKPVRNALAGPPSSADSVSPGKGPGILFSQAPFEKLHLPSLLTARRPCAPET